MSKKKKKKKSVKKKSASKALKKTAINQDTKIQPTYDGSSTGHPKIEVFYEEIGDLLYGHRCHVAINGKFLKFCKGFSFSADPNNSFVTVEMLEGLNATGSPKNVFHPTMKDISEWKCASINTKVDGMHKRGEFGSIVLIWKNIPFEIKKVKPGMLEKLYVKK